jgi:hypothetical protein
MHKRPHITTHARAAETSADLREFVVEADITAHSRTACVVSGVKLIYCRGRGSYETDSEQKCCVRYNTWI